MLLCGRNILLYLHFSNLDTVKLLKKCSQGPTTGDLRIEAILKNMNVTWKIFGMQLAMFTNFGVFKGFLRYFLGV